MNGHGASDRNQAADTAYERLRAGGPGGGLAVLAGFGMAGWLRRCQDAFETPSPGPAPRRDNGRAHLHPGTLATLLAEMAGSTNTPERRSFDADRQDQSLPSRA